MHESGAHARGLGAWVQLAWLGGCAAQLWQPVLWAPQRYAGVLAAACALALGLAGWRLRARPRSRPGPGAGAASLLLLLAVAAAAAAITGCRAAARAGDALPGAWDGRDVTVTGVVAAMSDLLPVGQRFLFEPESAWLDGAAIALRGPLLVHWWQPNAPGPGAAPAQPPPRVSAGERWRFVLRLRAPHGNINPHGFDYELWLWERGVAATATVRAGATGAAPRLLERTWTGPVERLRQWVRDAIVERIADRTAAGVIAALAVGDQRAIGREDWDLFRATGVAHLMSISGLHVTMFAWAAALLLRRAWRCSGRLCLACPAPHAGLAGGLLLAAAYAVFSGWGVPAQRTVWMLAVAGVLRLSGLRWPWPRVLLLAAVVVTAIDPWALLQPGFWLSFCAVGVLLAAGSAPQADARGGPAGALRQLLREQAVVTLALSPLTLLLFGQLSLLGLPANLLAIPWVTLVVTPLSLAGALFGPLWDVAGWAVAALLVVLRWLASVPGAVWSVPSPPTLLGAAALAGGVLLALRLPASLRLGGLALVLPAALWQPPRPAAGHFELLAADVGQGSAVLVRTAGHALLYDTGPAWADGSDAGGRILVPLLNALGAVPDAVVVSHRDTDHSGGAASVLDAFAAARLWTSIDGSHPLAGHPSRRPCQAGVRWRWDGVDFEFLHPAPGPVPASVKQNARSCVLRVSVPDGASALLAGDIEQPQEAALVAGDRAPALRADLLLVPHHGSRTSSSAPFLDAVQPRVALVQAGWRNRYGHPAPAVMQRYEARSIAAYTSPACGAMHWSSLRPGVVECERERQRRYWRHRP